MKLTDINKRILAGEPVLTGKFLGCTIEATQSGVKYESTKVSSPVRNIEIKRWNKKGVTTELVPRFVSIPVGSLVAVFGYAPDVRDGYLQHDGKDVVTVEP